MKVSELDLKKIPAPTIEKLFRKEGIEDLHQFKAICHQAEKGSYLFHTKDYHFNAPIEEVWNAYLLLHPCLLWDSDIIQFQMIFDRIGNGIIYRDSAFDKLAVGQIYFVNMKVIGGFHIPVLHEIAQVNEANFEIQTCYLNTGKSEGSQWIRLKKGVNGGTILTHETRYKGTNIIRDRVLYPYFHEKAIDRFHSNSKRSLEK